MLTRPRRGAALAFALALAGLAPGRAEAAAGPHRALVIGNDAYPKDARLTSCVNDAKAVASWLVAEGYRPEEITLLTDARKPAIIRALQDLARECKGRHHEQVVIFYSGHGTTLPDDDGDEGPGDDTDEAFVPIFAPGDPWEECVIRDDQFFLYVKAIAAETDQTLVLFDSCHSGGVLKGGLDDPKVAKAKEIPEGRLRRMLVDSGRPPGPLRESRADAPRKKDLGAATMPNEIGELPAGHRLVFIASSNPFQLSRAGDPLSAFTAAFIGGVFRERHKVVGADGVMTFDALRRYLEDALYAIPQSPVLVLKGLTRDQPFIPGLMPDPLKALQREQLMAVLESILTLPAANKVDGVAFDIRPSRPGPLRVGDRFALKVNSGGSGYLVVFTVSPGGDVSFLFPNRFRPNNQIDKGQDAMIPYREGLEIRPPVGEETYYAYLLEKNPFADFPFGRYGEALVVGRLEDVARRLDAGGKRVNAEDLRKALERGTPVGPAKTEQKPGGAAARGAWIRTAVTVKSVE